MLKRLKNSAESDGRFFSGIVHAVLFLLIFPIGGAIIVGVMIVLSTMKKGGVKC
ncbi:MAG: hypothetical protein U9O20_02510 [Patescibacteria group bacterium]|nr:hypothetical protein [Patescibacteria group bacterium]